MRRISPCNLYFENATAMSSRRNARERVVQALYAFELGGGEESAVINRIIRPGFDDDPTAFAFAESLFLATLDIRDQSEKLIRRHARNWELSRIALVDRLILRMAICELLKFEDIPPKVSINEAIDIAKKYSTANSGRFVNGILDAVVAELVEEGALRKSGRGRVGLESISGTNGAST